MNAHSSYDGEADSPAYSEFSMENLMPMTTIMNSRYDKTAKCVICLTSQMVRTQLEVVFSVALSHMVIDPGSFLCAEGPESVQ
jgi:hypothetical protein